MTIDPTTQRAIACLLAQRDKGVAKYGTTLHDADLTPLEVLRHAQQEAADLLAYLTREVMRMEVEA